MQGSETDQPRPPQQEVSVRVYHNALVKRFTDQRNDLMKRMASGACADYAAYREMAGKATQLQLVIDAMDQELQKLIEDDDD